MNAFDVSPLLRAAIGFDRMARLVETARAAADHILKQSGVTEGYCIDLGCSDGALAYELALKSKLHILAIDSDPTNVETARQKLTQAGLYGVRVTVHLGDPSRTS